MKFIKNKLGHVLITLSIFYPLAVFAQVVGGPPVDTQGKIVNPLAGNGIDNVPALIQKILEGALKIGIPIVALAIIYCGFLFVKARGKPEELKEAKGALLYTLIGAAILLGAYAIAQMISNTVLAL